MMRSFAAMSFGLPGGRSCTPEAIIRLLDAYDVKLEGRHAVVIGRSPILGKPVRMLLLLRNEIDAGYNAGNVGDVDFDQAINRASLLTPVPGGVGPMTIAVLLEQTMDAAEQRGSHPS